MSNKLTNNENNVVVINEENVRKNEIKEKLFDLELFYFNWVINFVLGYFIKLY